jgi:hypothetical protein
MYAIHPPSHSLQLFYLNFSVFIDRRIFSPKDRSWHSSCYFFLQIHFFNKIFMKKLIILICTAFLLLSTIDLPGHFISNNNKSPEPPEACKRILTINDADALVIIPQSGKFSTVTPGKWTQHVEALSPFKNAILENIVVTGGRSTNEGLTRLKSQ